MRAEDYRFGLQHPMHVGSPLFVVKNMNKEKGDCVSCQRPLDRGEEDWTCKECEERGYVNICEECCMNNKINL